jgi:hypothetical protein
MDATPGQPGLATLGDKHAQQRANWTHTSCPAFRRQALAQAHAIGLLLAAAILCNMQHLLVHHGLETQTSTLRVAPPAFGPPPHLVVDSDVWVPVAPSSHIFKLGLTHLQPQRTARTSVSADAAIL